MKLQIVRQIKKTWLYNLKDDPTKKVNLADTLSEKRKELETMLEDFNQKESVRPLWPSLIEAPVRIDETLDQSWEEDDEYVIYSN